MSLYIGNTAYIESDQSNALNFSANFLTGLSFTNNTPVRPLSPYFIVQGTGTRQTGTTQWWTIDDFNYTLANVGNCFSNNSRFTAPITGVYFFCAHLYGTKSPSTGQAEYTHPIFRINGSYTYRQASADTPYRIRTRTYSNGGYSWDTRISDIFYLVAGDYVEYHVYITGNQIYYTYHSMFAGFLVG